MKIEDLILTPEEILQADMEWSEAFNDKSCSESRLRAQTRKVLRRVVDYIHTHSTAHYEREWQGDDFVAVDYLWLKREDFDQLRKLAE